MVGTGFRGILYCNYNEEPPPNMLLVSSLGSYNLRAFSVVSGSTSVLPGGRQGSEDPDPRRASGSGTLNPESPIPLN